MYKKLGIIEPIEKDKILVDSLLELMNNYKSDYTNTFAALTLNKESNDALFKSNNFLEWRKQWKNRINYANDSLKISNLMKAQNPLIIPRNHLLELALENTKSGNFDEFDELLASITKPYNYRPNYSFQTVPEGFDDSYKTFCGT